MYCQSEKAQLSIKQPHYANVHSINELAQAQAQAWFLGKQSQA